MSLSIRPLSTGKLIATPKPTATYMRHWGFLQDSPILMFVVEGGDHPVIVDTGPGDPDYVKRWHGYQMEQAPEEEPAAALAAAGVDPLEVRLVINTHLHWDHSSNNDLFPNAEIIIQQREIDYAREPLQWSNAAYECLPGVTAPWRKAEDRIRAIDGDVELAPGISAVTLAGHTPGSQGVLVEGATKRFLVAGDCIGLYENWEGDERASHIPSGQFTNLFEYDASFRKIESFDCEVIPSHDQQVLDRGYFR